MRKRAVVYIHESTENSVVNSTFHHLKKNSTFHQIIVVFKIVVVFKIFFLINGELLVYHKGIGVVSPVALLLSFDAPPPLDHHSNMVKDLQFSIEICASLFFKLLLSLSLVLQLLSIFFFIPTQIIG